jgi:hypothetical protein
MAASKKNGFVKIRGDVSAPAAGSKRRISSKGQDIARLPKDLTDGEVDNYNRVVKQARLLTVTLLKSNFEKKDGYTKARRLGQLQHVYGCRALDVQFNQKQGFAYSQVQGDVEIKHKSKIFLKISAVYLIMYSELAGAHPEAVKRFVKRVGRFTVYPYFRSHVAHLSCDSQAEIGPLPILRNA